ncbi:hypothetical protein [Alkalilimnicola sp. S0819]|uniref:hypothetical protein n=1 Tax=Alkalilimnicola sp. S0819 TaxID=2613922 RepID=UPI001261B43E|nr:hypothetical protein [Alkalilimnicola sp. S0819]KAB7623401.1 hypothetical protein F3N43_09900 [Alkalilimnicola sp. S0819]MPQ16947.1 hypothetical protein [Alkalilimnicola sp. S0819]
MKAIRDPAELAAVEDVALRELLSRRIQEWLIDGLPYDPETYGWFLLVEPGDDPGDSRHYHDCPPLIGRPSAFDDLDEYIPIFEWVSDHGHWYEAVILLSDGGEFISVIVPKAEGVDPSLLAICEVLAEEEA